MRITKITLHNFKAFKGKHIFETDAPVVCFVGENNTGKTSIFKAVDFLMSGITKDKTIEDYRNANCDDEYVSVEIEICGKIKDVIEGLSQKKYEEYINISEDDDFDKIILKRSSEQLEIKQNNKPVTVSVKNISFYNFETRQFENPTGIDKAVSGIFEIMTIWSNFKTDELMDFSSTKPLGKLTKEISQSFMKCDDWKSFIEAHQQAFIKGQNSLANQTAKLKNNIQKSLKDFYGDASITFDFEPPEASSFIKLGMINIDDGVNTNIAEKGSGMQRAYAFAVMKVYADYLSQKNNSSEVDKPLFFFIDEPEISLHPRAQQTLFKALKDISTKQQVFISTHSPFLLKNFGDEGVITYMNKKNIDNICSEKVESMKTFTFSPTLAEINYFAFNIISNDFHCELYGYICSIMKLENPKDFDSWTTNNNILDYTKIWERDVNKEQGSKKFNVTLPTFIRNSIHHPENTYNKPFSSEELVESTEILLNIIKSECSIFSHS